MNAPPTLDDAMPHGAHAPVRSTVEGFVAEIALANGSLNLVTKPLLRALHAALTEVSANAGIRCLIVHGGEARAFCAGSDMREFEHLGEDASEEKILFEDLVLRMLSRVPMPTLAAIDGPALGGGLEIALACDLRVCRSGVALGLTESRVGGLAGNGSVRLARLIGPARAKDMLFTGETVSTDQALMWGLVNRVVEHSTAIEEARRMASTIAKRGPLSNRLAKRLVEAADDLPLDAALSMSTTAQQQIFDSRDLREGASAFFAKREPEFTGR